MGDKISDQSIMDKSMRSVFVGNIPYDATEEKLKEIFSEVGPVISLKLVFDRESGKPKGYGFCEYKDQETALSAMRNLNGYEIGGRTLRVDNACTEKSRMEMQQLLQGPQVENPYGEHCDAEQAPEIITKTVASLPPEQMYELMKEMKTCIQNNPSEARQMLLLNPQLAYALLQSMVVMRIVDPQIAVTMLFKPNQMPPVLTNQPIHMVPSASNNINHFAPVSQDIDLRGIVDPRLNRNMDLDMRSLASSSNLPSSTLMDSSFMRQSTTQTRPMPVSAPFQTDPRQRADPRVKPQPPPVPAMQAPLPNRIPTGIPNDASDQEKAALIMQVLQLSDDQIAMLPPEQRSSILVLKEQIAKSSQR